MSHTTPVAAVSGGLQSPRWLGRICAGKSNSVRDPGNPLPEWLFKDVRYGVAQRPGPGALLHRQRGPIFDHSLTVESLADHDPARFLGNAVGRGHWIMLRDQGGRIAGPWRLLTDCLTC